jgi:hypothetical protein
MSRFTPDDIQILSNQVYFDQTTSTKVKETSSLLQYESQHFRCKVGLQFHDSVADHNWSIGLIQACDRIYLENRYGDVGSSFWEFHPIRSARHKMVNDSDGRQYPFYSVSSSKCEIRRGTVHDSSATLQYEDHFYPTVAWQLPYCGGAHLTDVIRKQDFWIWLVAIKRGTRGGLNGISYDYFDVYEDRLYVLKTMRWRFNLHMKFDPHLPPGRRLRKIYDAQEELPYVLETDRPVPISAISPPHCNAAQSLIWYPKSCLEKPRILVPPRQIIVPWETWLSDMLPSRISSNYPRAKDCKLVGEWSRDEEIGVPSSSHRHQSRTHKTSQPRKHLLSGTSGTRRSSSNKIKQGSSRSWSRPRHHLVENALNPPQDNRTSREIKWEGDA